MLNMLSMYGGAWYCIRPPLPPPGIVRPVPRLPPLKEPSPTRSSSSCSSVLDVEGVDEEAPRLGVRVAILDVACCDGPVRFTRVKNDFWKEEQSNEYSGGRTNGTQSYPCKTCGCKFPSYYFVHKHRKRCHNDST